MYTNRDIFGEETRLYRAKLAQRAIGLAGCEAVPFVKLSHKQNVGEWHRTTYWIGRVTQAAVVGQNNTH
jgi:hypothetical protein